MKNFFNLNPAFVVISAGLFCACGSSEPENEVVINDQYSIMLPGFLQEATELHDEASLQYVNYLREFYVLVIDELVEDVDLAFEQNLIEEKYHNGLDGYADYMMDYMVGAMKPSFRSPIVKTEINSLESRLMFLEGMVEGDIEVYYAVAYIRGKEHYYQVVTWTLLERKEKYEKTMNQMIQTFRELEMNGLKLESE